MPGGGIIIISGGGGSRLNAEYGVPYAVAAGDTADNPSGGAVELHFTGDTSGFAVIPLSGYAGYQFPESGTVAVYQ